jgi:hypothetical protein
MFGDRITLARDQPLEGGCQVAVHGRLVRRLDLEVEHQSKFTFPRVCLTALRCRFFSTRSRLAARLGRVGLRFRWTIWAAAIISASLRRASAGSRPESGTAGRDEKLAAARHPAARDLLQPPVGVGVQAEPEDIDAQLDCGRHLVDILPARAGGREEAFAQCVSGMTTSSGRIDPLAKIFGEAAR